MKEYLSSITMRAGFSSQRTNSVIKDWIPSLLIVISLLNHLNSIAIENCILKKIE